MDARLARILELVPQICEAKTELRTSTANITETLTIRALDPEHQELAHHTADMLNECLSLLDELTDDMGLNTLSSFCDFAKAIMWLDTFAHSILRHVNAELN